MTDQNSSSNATTPAAPAAPAAKPRRRGLIIGGVAALAIVAGVGVAISQPGHWGPGHGGGYGQSEGHGRGHGGMMGRMGGGDRMNPEKMGARIDWGVDRMLTDASPEQKQKVAALMKDAFKDLAPVRDQAQAARADVARLLKADKIDRAEIERLRAQRMGEMEVASKRMAQAVGDLGETLTPKQRVELVSRMEGFAFGRGHRH